MSHDSGHIFGETVSAVACLIRLESAMPKPEEHAMTRVALYARYSSDSQRDASIEDQLKVCRIHAVRQEWTVVGTYQDRAISGASLIRHGIQSLLADALSGKFDIVLSEALDRLSRDQEDVAGVFKRLAFADVKIITLSEGEISHLHVGLKGTMNALFLKDLADKTRRGLRGRVEAGKSGGGLCYGYEVVRSVDAAGQPINGERRIKPEEADIVRRIFHEFAIGHPPRRIAVKLNSEGVPGPLGRSWGDTTIRGHVIRGTGVLNNELYIGRLIWNRQRYLKDPDSGRRVSRRNAESDWIVAEVPELRIIDDALWQEVRDRQAELSKIFAASNNATREANAKRSWRSLRSTRSCHLGIARAQLSARTYPSEPNGAQDGIKDDRLLQFSPAGFLLYRPNTVLGGQLAMANMVARRQIPGSTNDSITAPRSGR